MRRRIQIRFESTRRDAQREAERLKDPYYTLDALFGLYGSLSMEERQHADQVIADWVLSDDEGLRFDALALVSEFDIVATLPAMDALTNRLRFATEPGAPFELKAIRRITSRFEHRSTP